MSNVLWNCFLLLLCNPGVLIRHLQTTQHGCGITLICLHGASFETGFWWNCRNTLQRRKNLSIWKLLVGPKSVFYGGVIKGQLLSKFCLQFAWIHKVNGFKKVFWWHCVELTQHYTEHTIPTLTHGGSSIMLQGSFSSAVTVKLGWVDGNIDGAKDETDGRKYFRGCKSLWS